MFIFKSLILVVCFSFTSAAVAECTKELKQELSLAKKDFNTSLEVNSKVVADALTKIQNFTDDYDKKEGWLSVPLLRYLFWIRTKSYTFIDVQNGITALYPLASDYNILSDKGLKFCESNDLGVNLPSYIIEITIEIILLNNILFSTSTDPVESKEYLFKVQEKLNELSVIINE